jgi:Protein of unknown function (DUF3102)
MSAVLKVSEAEAAKLITARSHVTGAAKGPPVLTVVPVPEPVVEQPGRPLVEIERDVGALAKTQRQDIFKMGALLIEAKRQVLHGDWLPWLREHFGRSESTANNYMNAARLLVKSPTVGDLKLSAGAIFWLVRNWDKPNGTSVMEIAKTCHVDADYCRDLDDRSEERQRKAARTAQALATRARNKADPSYVTPGARRKLHDEQIAAAAAKVLSRPQLTTPSAIEASNLEAQALGIIGAGIGSSGRTKQKALAEFRATLSPEELQAFDLKRERHGQLTGSVKVLCRLAPNIADVIDARIEPEQLREAADVLLKLRAIIR